MNRFLVHARDQREAFVEACAWAEEVILCLGWLEGGDEQGPSWDVLQPHLRKVTLAAVGLSFMRSEPALLQALYETGSLRIVSSTDGGYAPNLFFFKRGERVRIMLGSAPFSSTAHEESVEHWVLYETERTDPFSLSILQFIERCRSCAHLPDPNELSEYKAARLKTLVRMRATVDAPLSGRAQRFQSPIEDVELVSDPSLVKTAAIRMMETLEHACSWEGTRYVRVRRERRPVHLLWVESLRLWAAFLRTEDQYWCGFGTDAPHRQQLDSEIEVVFGRGPSDKGANAAIATARGRDALFLVLRGTRKGRGLVQDPELFDHFHGGTPLSASNQRCIVLGEVTSPAFASGLAGFVHEWQRFNEVVS